MNEFVKFYLQKYFDLFSFKKNDFYKLLKKNMTLFEKEFVIKKKKCKFFISKKTLLIPF